MKEVNFPYIDLILNLINSEGSLYEKAFGENLHWGYWKSPHNDDVSAEDFKQATERLTEKVLEIAGIKDNQTILDVGCGFGGTIGQLNKKHKGQVLYGINLDPNQLDRARGNIKSTTNNSIEFILADANKLPFENNKFDAIIAIESIFHLKNREIFIKEAHRVLKKGGQLIFTDFVPIELLLPITKLISQNSSYSGFFGAIYADYSIEKYNSLTEKEGFKSRNITDITENTLPTYRFLFEIGKELAFKAPEAIIPTFLLSGFSSARLIKYLIFSYEKL